jgi:hypothetical protein
MPVEAHGGRVVVELATRRVEDDPDTVLHGFPRVHSPPPATTAATSMLSALRSSMPSVRNISRSPGSSGCGPYACAGTPSSYRWHETDRGACIICGPRITLRRCDGASRDARREAPVLRRRGQARCAADPCRHRGESGRDGAPVLVTLAVRDRGRAHHGEASCLRAESSSRARRRRSWSTSCSCSAACWGATWTSASPCDPWPRRPRRTRM